MVRYTSIKNQIKRYIYNIGLIFEENVKEILNENNLLSNYRCITVSALPTPSLSLWCPCWYCTTGRKNGENIKFRVSVKILKPRKINSSTYAAHPCVTSRLHHIKLKMPWLFEDIRMDWSTFLQWQFLQLSIMVRWIKLFHFQI